VRETQNGNGALIGGTAERGEQQTAEGEENTHRARDLNLDIAGFKKGNNKARA